MMDLATMHELRRSFSAAVEHEDPLTARESLLDAGWLDALREDDQGAIALAFGLQGRRGIDIGVLDDVLLGHIDETGVDPADIAIAYPVLEPSPPDYEITNVLLPARPTTKHVLWVSDLGGQRIELIDRSSLIVTSKVRGIDPYLGLMGVGKPQNDRVLAATITVQEGKWKDAIAAGRVALSHQLNAGSHALLDMAVDYAKIRHQFGAPIASFQAVKHRLAETAVALAAADAAVLAASNFQEPERAAIAKALAGRAAAAAARNCLQVFGGIGFTIDHDFHRYFRRSLVLDRLLGDHKQLERRFGEIIRRARHLPDGVAHLTDEPRFDLLQV
jgi:acyl-CoA dehydrogenase-like protein